jgi:hypothetical protein
MNGGVNAQWYRTHDDDDEGCPKHQFQCRRQLIQNDFNRRTLEKNKTSLDHLVVHCLQSVNIW